MKQSLQLKLGQHLTMTPQLQQAIRLLQLSSLELGLEVQQALDSNLMLELAEDDADTFDFASEAHEAATGEETSEFGGEELSDFFDGEAGGQAAGEGGEEFSPPSTTDDIPNELPVDSDWEEIYDSTLPQTGSGGAGEDGRGAFETARGGISLRDHLLWQLNLLPLSKLDLTLATAIVDAINEAGYLEASLAEIRDIVQASTDLGEVDEDEVAAMLKQVQALDPAGIAARDLKECLLLQLQQLPADTPWLAEAQAICERHLAALGGREFAAVMRRTKLTQEELRQVMSLIQTLNPKPGAQFSDAAPEYLIPDVFVRKSRARWKVELNPDSVPHVRVNSQYANLIRRADNGADNTTLKTHLQEAKWFIKSLQSRSETLLKVAVAIVERQQAFLEFGDEGMKPLVLHDIADALGMHESTISRVTTRKYLHTPRGTYELKYFFSSHVTTSIGGEASSTAIRALIKKLIASEASDKPLSDSVIAGVLLKQGINVARRTVAKYREGMQILPSNERKRLS
ncbi:MAG: RNA polymerase factor sigma-54 [Gammaproteobacteria bacterium]|nr:RNA polymerase factor sigma-54 [Gammaproteobacteria bacterium]